MIISRGPRSNDDNDDDVSAAAAAVDDDDYCWSWLRSCASD